MELGIVGKPNVGKSTFFSALTLNDVSIANYPFTTINANIGVSHIRTKCPHLDTDVVCNPRVGYCKKGVRWVPVQMIDVAGLVPGAYEGKGLGNKFLDDVRKASALIHIVDASGSTDSEGNPIPPGTHNPMDDISFLENEIVHWIAGIIEKGWERISRRIELEGLKLERMMGEKLTGLGISEESIYKAIRESELPSKPSKWKKDDMILLARKIRKKSKPMIIAANKADKTSEEELKKLLGLENYIIIPTSAEYELALRKAAQKGLIEYSPGDKNFKIIENANLSNQQKHALDKISEYMEKFNGTGVQKVIERAIYDLLGLIIVYPVEDENKWCDHDGRVLPDAYAMKPLTVLDMAYKVHTDLGENFIRAVDGRTKRILGHDHGLKNGDVIKIIAKK